MNQSDSIDENFQSRQCEDLIFFLKFINDKIFNSSKIYLSNQATYCGFLTVYAEEQLSSPEFYFIFCIVKRFWDYWAKKMTASRTSEKNTLSKRSFLFSWQYFSNILHRRVSKPFLILRYLVFKSHTVRLILCLRCRFDRCAAILFFLSYPQRHLIRLWKTWVMFESDSFLTNKKLSQGRIELTRIANLPCT